MENSQVAVVLNSTNSNSNFELPPFFARVAALLIDSFILLVIVGTISYALLVMIGRPSSLWTAVGSIVVFLLFNLGVTILYYDHYYKTRAATPGKFLVNLKVVNAENSEIPITIKQIIMREIVGKMFIYHLTGGLECLLALLTDKRITVHDFISGTRVVRPKNMN